MPTDIKKVLQEYEANLGALREKADQLGEWDGPDNDFKKICASLETNIATIAQYGQTLRENSPEYREIVTILGKAEREINGRVSDVLERSPEVKKVIDLAFKEYAYLDFGPIEETTQKVGRYGLFANPSPESPSVSPRSSIATTSEEENSEFSDDEITPVSLDDFGELGAGDSDFPDFPNPDDDENSPRKRSF